MPYLCRILSVCFTIFCSLQIIAQGEDSVYPWESVYMDWLEMEDMDNSMTSDEHEYLQSLYLEKLDLNHASQEELEQLPFLSAQQVEEIMAHIYRYGEFYSVGELQMIESLDAATRQLLLQFVRISYDPERVRRPSDTLLAKRGVAKLFQHVRHTLTATVGIPLYDRRGDIEAVEHGGFLGPKWKHSWRYTLKTSAGIEFGFLGAQDGGEPFLTAHNRWGYDFYTGFVAYHSKGMVVGKERNFYLKELVVGRYKLRTGMGLAVNRNNTLGKTFILASLGRGYSSLSGYLSKSEANYLQGAGLTVGIMERRTMSLTGTAFYSWRKVDGTPDESGLGIRTLLASGYHRTQSEMNRRSMTYRQDYGGNVNWRWRQWHAGLTVACTQFGLPLLPRIDDMAARWSPRGRTFANLSVDYGYITGKVNLSGETAVADNGALATINVASWQPNGTLSLMALQRFYSYRYHALLGNSFASGGHLQNESGLYVGGKWEWKKGLLLEGYADIARYAWARYRVSAPSYSIESMLGLNGMRNMWSWNGRYRWKRSMKDASGSSKMATINEHRGRILVKYGDEVWTVGVRLDGVAVYEEARMHWGWMPAVESGWRCKWLSVWSGIGYFRTTDYQARIYGYEKTLLYTMSFPMVYGEGLRGALYLSGRVGEWLTVSGKVALVKYYDRNSISTGMQEIKGSCRADVGLQVRIKF